MDIRFMLNIWLDNKIFRLENKYLAFKLDIYSGLKYLDIFPIQNGFQKALNDSDACAEIIVQITK